MKTIQLQAHAGRDGVLDFRIPAGAPHTDFDVVVIINPADHAPGQSPDPEWAAFVDRFAGCCAGLGLERPPQGEYEVREQLP